ncbi:MAG TPA: hypothetical protein QF469_02605 [Sphingomonas sanguinis]|uniref:hypothetical protein n=1 Tax=Sphingomonas sanguinis TaxID=33051 RepID=UPI002AC049E9|nr:hypothetical protein [Sphingomonas sanguinis]
MINSYTVDAGALGFESVKDTLRLLVKQQKRFRGSGSPGQRSAAKEYCHMRSGFLMHCCISNSKKFDLLFVRVPHGRPHSEETISAKTHNPSEDAGNDAPYLETNGVFGVGNSRYRSNEIVSPGISFTSRVWLLPFNLLPQERGDLGFSFPASQAMAQVYRAVSPGIVQLLPGVIDRGASRKDGLIERIPKIVESFRPPLLDDVGQIPLLDYLIDVVPRIRIELNLFDEGARILAEGQEMLDSFMYGALRPIDGILGALERISYGSMCHVDAA